MANVCAHVRIFSNYKYNFCSSQWPGQITTCKILFRLDILFGLKLRPCTPDSDRFSLTHSNLTHPLTHVLLCYNIIICSSSKFKLISVSFLESAQHKGLGTTCQISSPRRRVPCALAGCPVQAAGCRVVPASWYLCPLCALCNHCKDQTKWCWYRSGLKGSTATIKLKVELIKIQSGGGEHLLRSLCFNHTDVGGGLYILTIDPCCLALPFT